MNEKRALVPGYTPTEGQGNALLALIVAQGMQALMTQRRPVRHAAEKPAGNRRSKEDKKARLRRKMAAESNRINRKRCHRWKY